MLYAYRLSWTSALQWVGEIESQTYRRPVDCEKAGVAQGWIEVVHVAFNRNVPLVRTILRKPTRPRRSALRRPDSLDGLAPRRPSGQPGLRERD